MDVEGRTSNANDNSLTHNPEHGQEKDIPNDSYDLSTAHTIDRGIVLFFSAKFCFKFYLCKLISFSHDV